jgi:hypothetical protein
MFIKLIFTLRFGSSSPLSLVLLLVMDHISLSCTKVIRQSLDWSYTNRCVSLIRLLHSMTCECNVYEREIVSIFPRIDF